MLPKRRVIGGNQEGKVQKPETTLLHDRSATVLYNEDWKHTQMIYNVMS